ncbi:MAG: hypothetical protein QOE55_3562 [Acidobacteriaceae bacterium]|nr:hypothetical protein [Acidobacteriaceae bacterium]
MLNTIDSATQCSVMLAGTPCNGMLPLSATTLPPSVQSIIHTRGVRCRGYGSVRTMSGSSSGK